MKDLEITYLNCQGERVVLTLPKDARIIRVNLAPQEYIDVELFERNGQEGLINVRGSYAMKILPVAGNSICVGIAQE